MNALLLAALTTILAASDSSPAVPPAAAQGVLQVALLKLEGNKLAQDDAPGVTSLLASRLAESPRLKVITQAEISLLLGVERERRLLSPECSSDQCMVELSGALGSRFLVTGRIDRFGDRYVVTTSVYDAQKGSSLAKPRAEVDDAEKLPDAAAAVARQIETALGVSKEGFAGPGKLHAALKAGTGFISDVMALSPGGDAELGFRFAEEWIVLLQVGFKFVWASSGTGSGSINLLPNLVGIRKLYLTEGSFQPFWGLGIGIQLSFGGLGIFDSTGPLPSVWASAGFQYMFSRRFGVLLEGKTNLAQATLGLAGSNVGGGFNMDLAAGMVARF